MTSTTIGFKQIILVGILQKKLSQVMHLHGALDCNDVYVKYIFICIKYLLDISEGPASIAGKAATCDDSIPYGRCFVPQLLLFQSSSLLMYVGKQQSITQMPGLLSPAWETLMKLLAPCFGLA